MNPNPNTATRTRPPRPNFIDLRPQLHLRPDVGVKTRDLAGLTHVGVHYNARLRPATPYNEVAMIQSDHNYHKTRNWNVDRYGRPRQPVIHGAGLMYPFVIGGSGRIYWCRNETDVTWSINDGNDETINIMLHCGENQEATPEQLITLRATLLWLCYNRGDMPYVVRERVFGHSECGAKGPGPKWGNKTKCPGRILPHVVAFREGRW